MSGTGPKLLGGFALGIGALGLIAAMFLATAAYLDESDNQDRNPGLLDPDRADADRSGRNAHLSSLAMTSASTGAVAMTLGGALLAVGSVLDRSSPRAA